MQFFSFFPWLSIVNFCGMTLLQVNLGIPKFPTLFLANPKGAQQKILTLISSKDLK